MEADDPRLYAGAEGAAARDARHRLIEHLTQRGASLEEIAEAAAAERLATLPLEYSLGSGERMTVDELARQAGVEIEFARTLWRSLGHAPDSGKPVFTKADVESARMIEALLEAGVPRDGLLEGARVMGHAMSRVASAIRRVGGDAFIEPGDSEYELALRYEQAAAALVPLFAPFLFRELEVHLREQAQRDVITRAQLEAGSIAGARPVAIGFADLSGFTRLGEELGSEELGEVGSRFGMIAADAATGGVELVKMIGDGAMFAAADPQAAVEAALAIVGGSRELGAEFPPARAGVAFGDAVPYSGDWFGATVNRASRICGAARADSVLIDEATFAALGSDAVVSRPTQKRLRGIEGQTTLYRVDSLQAVS